MLLSRCGTPALVPAVTLDDATQHDVILTQLYRPSPEICTEFELEYIQINSSRLPVISTTNSTIVITTAASDSISHFRALPTASILLFLKVNSSSHSTINIQIAPSSTTTTGLIYDDEKHSVYDGLILFLPAHATAKLSVPRIQQQINNSLDYDILVYRAHINLG